VWSICTSLSLPFARHVSPAEEAAVQAAQEKPATPHSLLSLAALTRLPVEFHCGSNAHGRARWLVAEATAQADTN
jgi:hypothetical protein